MTKTPYNQLVEKPWTDSGWISNKNLFIEELVRLI